ncbi:ABC transporter permease [Marinospirillum alkaliphilum]|uniref:ABC-type transport system, involved in lipoprotein release, permease component n=1 Tax=Marinospirillum alkaliphilum DSM 21637 TaxID=1122209 RepID=A0A1K1XEW8_9GAMM|nr:FtsX-like permease family protein [Marinospirillum alkaliphilum]SFX48095.1 ABC-type transport system, involved in lipoprotein release, permease component [Marinospirillum alkaliphilum DSM 21637]
MTTLMLLAWRNVWRNPARSAVLLLAIALGLWAGLLMVAVSQGMLVQRFERLIEQEFSHLQVHHPQFLTEREVQDHLPDVAALQHWLQQQPELREHTLRVLVDGMIQSPALTAGVEIRGVDPQRERRVSQLDTTLNQGKYLDAALRNPILMGARLAEKLRVRPGQRVVLTFQDTRQELVSASFTLSGTFTSLSRAEEESRVYVPAEVLSAYLADQAIWHQLAVLLQHPDQGSAVAARLQQAFPQVQALAWLELSPELRFLTEMGDLLTWILIGVILLALAFGLLNTLLMATFERTHELGMLLAIGMNKRRVFGLITLESLLITASGALLGVLLALLNINWLAREGLDLSRFGGAALAEFGYDTLIVPVLGSDELLAVALLVVLTALLAALYPAWKALQLNPAQAVRN